MPAKRNGSPDVTVPAERNGAVTVSWRTPIGMANGSCVKSFGCLNFLNLHINSAAFIPRFSRMVHHGRNDTAGIH